MTYRPVTRDKRKLSRRSWAYRIRRLRLALGWSYMKVSIVAGIVPTTVNKIMRADDYGYKRQHMQPRIETIKKILHMEEVYADIIKRYNHDPNKMCRLWQRQKYLMRPLQPVRIREFTNRKAMGLLERDHKLIVENFHWPSALPPPHVLKIRRDRINRANEKRAQTWARKLAGGWDWHENNKKLQAGRPYYNMGKKRAMEAGIPYENVPKKASTNRKKYLIEAEIERKKKDDSRRN